MTKSTSWLVCSVIAAHALAVCLVLLIQGCGTTTGPREVVDMEPAQPVPTRTVLPPRAHSERAVPTRVTPPVRVSAPRSAEPESKTYVIQKGDSLSMIAMRFNLTVTQILALNRLESPDLIQVGQRLTLPASVNLNAPKPVRKSTSKPAATPSGPKYVVKPGDTLSEIALNHGVSVKSIQEANGLKGDLIYVGQAFVIPGGKPKQTVADAEERVVPEAPTPAPGPVEDPVEDVAGPVEDVVDDAGADPISTDVVEDVSTDDPAAGLEDVPLTMHTHEVKPGEDLYSVSLIWDVSIEELKRINGLSGTDLTAGQILRIPRAQ